jgi:chondroitin 4-sulfotransferase 11
MLSHPFRCIYIHIPKTAGNSVNRVFGVDWQHHKDLQRFAAELEPALFERYFKFAIVRNPWERIFSDYNYQKKKGRPGASKLFLFDETGERRCFRDWVEAALSDPYRYAPESWGGEVSAGLHRWSPQVDWLTVDGRIAVDAIVRMERLPEDFGRICETLGLPPLRLPHRNRRRHWHYSWYYDEATRDLVASYYARDVAAFGYRFETTKIARAWELSQSAVAPLRRRGPAEPVPHLRPEGINTLSL